MLVVTVPTLGAGSGGPTGQVFNATSDFEVSPGAPARFLFATLPAPADGVWVDLGCGTARNVEAWGDRLDIKVQEVREVLAMMLFRGDDIEKKIGMLSGGERARIRLAQLLLDKPNAIVRTPNAATEYSRVRPVR